MISFECSSTFDRGIVKRFSAPSSSFFLFLLSPDKLIFSVFLNKHVLVFDTLDRKSNYNPYLLLPSQKPVSSVDDLDLSVLFIMSSSTINPLLENLSLLDDNSTPTMSGNDTKPTKTRPVGYIRLPIPGFTPVAPEQTFSAASTVVGDITPSGEHKAPSEPLISFEKGNYLSHHEVTSVFASLTNIPSLQQTSTQQPTSTTSHAVSYKTVSIVASTAPHS